MGILFKEEISSGFIIIPDNDKVKTIKGMNCMIRLCLLRIITGINIDHMPIDQKAHPANLRAGAVMNQKIREPNKGIYGTKSHPFFCISGNL